MCKMFLNCTCQPCLEYRVQIWTLCVKDDTENWSISSRRYSKYMSYELLLYYFKKLFYAMITYIIPFPSTSPSLQKNLCSTWFLLRNHFLKRKSTLQNIHPGDFYYSFCVWWGDILCININILKVRFEI